MQFMSVLAEVCPNSMRCGDQISGVDQDFSRSASSPRRSHWQQADQWHTVRDPSSKGPRPTEMNSVGSQVRATSVTSSEGCIKPSPHRRGSPMALRQGFSAAPK